MNNGEVLAQLVVQAADEGGDIVTLRAIVEEASELGARRMVGQLGLDDDTAIHDLSELRELLQAWRDAKASAWKATVEWCVRGVLALLLLGIAWRLGAMEALR